MARADAGLRTQLDSIVEKHAGADALRNVSERPSANANFIGVTYLIQARDEAQIAALFEDLKQCRSVLLVI